MIDHADELRRRWIKETQNRAYDDDYLHCAWLRAINWLRTTSRQGWILDKQIERRR